jgi:hypothetical protein
MANQDHAGRSREGACAKICQEGKEEAGKERAQESEHPGRIRWTAELGQASLKLIKSGHEQGRELSANRI